MDAALKNASLMGYKVPTAADVPPIEVILLEHPDPNGPYGAKSAGEVGITPPAGAIANAVADALGVRVYEAPLTPERILAALEARGREPRGAAGPRGRQALLTRRVPRRYCLRVASHLHSGSREDSMYSYVKNVGVPTFLVREAPAFAMSFLVAEVFYKFHSFTLECLAFLATWYALSWLQSTVIRPRGE